MHLDPRRPALYVLQATITDGEGRSALVARAMPAAPLGSPAWQLPLLAGYLTRLRRAADAPSVRSFTDYLDARKTTVIPAPHQPYAYTPWHDSRVTCLIDVTLTPQGSMGWPAVSLVVFQQETVPPPCSWNHLERHRGYLAVLAHTVDAITAERDRLARHITAGHGGGLRDMQELAADVTAWTRKLHKGARADHTLARAAAVRAHR